MCDHILECILIINTLPLMTRNSQIIKKFNASSALPNRSKCLTLRLIPFRNSSTQMSCPMRLLILVNLLLITTWAVTHSTPTRYVVIKIWGLRLSFMIIGITKATNQTKITKTAGVSSTMKSSIEGRRMMNTMSSKRPLMPYYRNIRHYNGLVTEKPC
jgi:hypothetical protein